MATRPTVDAAAAVALHRDKGWRVERIAMHFGVQKPAVYRAFRKQQYFTADMAENRRPRRQRIQTNARGYPTSKSENYAANALPVVKLAPCFRCGSRGEICGCRVKTAVGWHVG